jgi:hypothetical protein
MVLANTQSRGPLGSRRIHATFMRSLLEGGVMLESTTDCGLGQHVIEGGAMLEEPSCLRSSDIGVGSREASKC